MLLVSALAKTEKKKNSPGREAPDHPTTTSHCTCPDLLCGTTAAAVSLGGKAGGLGISRHNTVKVGPENLLVIVRQGVLHVGALDQDVKTISRATFFILNFAPD